jgi:hypothetical protein
MEQTTADSRQHQTQHDSTDSQTDSTQPEIRFNFCVKGPSKLRRIFKKKTPSGGKRTRRAGAGRQAAARRQATACSKNETCAPLKKCP